MTKPQIAVPVQPILAGCARQHQSDFSRILTSVHKQCNIQIKILWVFLLLQSFFFRGGSNFMLCLKIKGSLLAPKSTIKFPLISGKTGLS